MNERPDAAERLDRSIVKDCWNTIGVGGDRSCPELKEHIHCRNCPVYSAGAAALLDGESPSGYLAEWTSHFAQPKRAEDVERRSIVIFRIGSEWLALPTSVVIEVANLLPVHSLPHRHSGAVLGLANVRGELLICVSLGEVVGVETSLQTSRARRSAVYRRLLVIRRDDVRVVCPVDEVHGVHHVHSRELKDVPATVSRATLTYSTALLSWRDRSVGILDDQLVFYSLKRGLG
jgi:chemotaxis-related protein WspD